MLMELAVRNLGVVKDISVVFGNGMTAITGETGAGKTLIVGAIELLCGARADASLIRSGCDEAEVQGRFLVEGDEVVARRVIPRIGRSRRVPVRKAVHCSRTIRLGPDSRGSSWPT